MLKEDEAVVVAIEEHNDSFQERNLDDFKNDPSKLLRGFFRGKNDDLYAIDIFEKGFGTKTRVNVKGSALGIPIEANVTNSIGTKVLAFGFVGLDADFNANELEVYSDLGIKKIPKGEYNRIKIWE